MGIFGGETGSLPKGWKKPEYKHIKVINEAHFNRESEVRLSDDFDGSSPDRPFSEQLDIIKHDPRLELSWDTYVQMIYGSGPEITGENKRIKKILKEWFKEISFEDRIEDGLYSYVGVGNLILEKEPRTGSDFAEVPIDTVVGITTGRKGQIGKYVQHVNNKDIFLRPDEVVHFKFTNSNQELFGRGLFHSVIHDFTDPQTNVTYQAPIFAMKDIEDGLVKIVQNYASPIMMFHFKDAGETFIEKQGDALKKARPGAKILTDKEFEVKVFEAKGDSKFEKYIEHMQRDVIEPGSEFPLQFFNAGFTARAASESTDSVLIRKVKRIKKRFINQIKEFMIEPYLKKRGITVKDGDYDLKLPFDNKVEFDINQLTTLFRDNAIRRDELRKNLAMKTDIEIDESDMERLPPITSVTPTNDFDNQEPKPIPQRDAPEDDVERSTKVDIEEESFKKEKIKHIREMMEYEKKINEAKLMNLGKMRERI